MLLRLEPVSLDDPAAVLAGADHLERSERIRVALELLGTHCDLIEMAPPIHLVLAPVIREQRRKQPSRSLGTGLHLGVRRQIADQRARDLLGRDDLRLKRLAHGAFDDRWTLDGSAAERLLLDATRLEPVAQLRGGDAVALVVHLDLVEQRGVAITPVLAADQPSLVHDHAARSVSDRTPRVPACTTARPS